MHTYAKYKWDSIFTDEKGIKALHLVFPWNSVFDTIISEFNTKVSTPHERSKAFELSENPLKSQKKCKNLRTNNKFINIEEIIDYPEHLIFYF